MNMILMSNISIDKDVKSSISPSCAHPLNNPQLEFPLILLFGFIISLACVSIFALIFWSIDQTCYVVGYETSGLDITFQNMFALSAQTFTTVGYGYDENIDSVVYKYVNKLCTQQLIFLFCIVTLSSQQQGYICQMLAYQHISYIGMVHFVSCWCNHNWYPYR